VSHWPEIFGTTLILANPTTIHADSTVEEKQKKEKEAADAERDEKIYELEQERLGKLMIEQEDDLEQAKNAHKSAQEAVDKAAKDDETQILSIAEIAAFMGKDEYTQTGMERTSDLVPCPPLMQLQKSPMASLPRCANSGLVRVTQRGNERKRARMNGETAVTRS
jgi:hypothetical protein